MSRRWLVIALALVAAVLLAGRAAATLYTDYLWYAASGATAVWRARLANAVLLRGASALVGGFFVFVNLYAVRQSVVSLVLPRRVGNIEIGEEVPGRYLMTAVVVVSLLFALLFFGAIPSDAWVWLGQVRYGQSFRESDPYFLLDLGFYVYWLPLERALYYWSLIALVMATALVVFLYALTPSLRWERGALRVSTWVRRHLGLIGALLLFLLAWSYRLDAYDVLSYGSGADGTFTYADHKVMIPANLLLALVALVAALTVAWSSWAGHLRVTFFVVTGVLVLSLVLRQLLPAVAQRLAPHADPVQRELKYAATRAGFTRRAYGVELIRAGDSTAAYAGLAEAARGLALWDPGAAARALERTRRGGEIVAAPAWLPGPEGPVLAFALHPAADDSTGPDGWALARVLATATDDRGALVRVDAHGAAAYEDTPVRRAIVYPGARGYAVVPDTTNRVAASEISSWSSRLAHAWSEQNFRLLLGDLPHPRPRIVLRRDARARVHALAPWFVQGRETGMAVLGDSLLWVIELHVASGDYPLSSHVELSGERWSYFHHAATAFVNAATGGVVIAADAVQEPIARTWTTRFPSLFVARASLPAELLRQLPPAAEGAMAQALAFARYGPRRPLSEHTGAEVAWAAAQVARTRDDSIVGGSPAFVVTADGRLAMPLPLFDAANRMPGLLLATGGAEPALQWFPAAEPQPRWPAIRARLRQVPENARDGRVAAGGVRVVPLGDRFVFAQPFYQWPPSGAPTVARAAIVASDTTLAGRTFAEAAGVLASAPLVPAAPATPAQFRARVEALYDAMRGALRDGDWLRFGAAYDSLGRVLGRTPAQP